MRSVNDWLEILKKDEDLNGLIKSSKQINQTYQIRKRSKKTQESKALDHFWGTQEGINFRIAAEKKGLNIGDKQAVGALKTALLVYITELRADKR